MTGDFVAALTPSEARAPYSYVPSWTPQWLANQIVAFFSDTDAIREAVQKAAAWAGMFLTGFSKRIIQGMSAFVFDLVIVFMTSFFFIRDGERIIWYLESITPLSHDEKKLFFSRAKHMVNSVVYGIVLTVAIQAALGAAGWWFAGLPSPAFFGMLMFFFGMLPGGTSIIWAPGAVYLAIKGDYRHALFLFLWGAVLVSTIDNFLRPFLIKATGNGEEASTLLIIIGLFGGVIAWGFIGVFLGPLVMVLFTIVLDIYRSRWTGRPEGSC
jgi:predicted PurR-regulated permease PerM